MITSILLKATLLPISSLEVVLSVITSIRNFVRNNFEKSLEVVLSVITSIQNSDLNLTVSRLEVVLSVITSIQTFLNFIR